MRRDLDGEHSTECRERVMTEMRHEERLANAEDERDAVRPRAMQSRMKLRTTSPSAEPGGNRNRDQSVSGNMQVQGLEVKGSSSEAIC